MGFAASSMTLTTPAFADRSPIPLRHSAYGDNVSPAFAWTDVPAGAASFALVCDDPDAPMVSAEGRYGFVHWVLYNIPAHARSLEEGVDPHRFTTGPNDLGEPAYFGPQPPAGHGVHAYYFLLLALRRGPDLPAGLDVRALLASVEPDVVGMSRIVGTYEQPAG